MPRLQDAIVYQKLKERIEKLEREINRQSDIIKDKQYKINACSCIGIHLFVSLVTDFVIIIFHA